MNTPVSSDQNCGSIVPARRRERGFTFLELVVVIVLLGLLAATALPRFLSVTDDAQKASLEGVAGGFSTAVSMAKAQWSVDGHSAGGPTTPANKVATNYDGKIVYMNEYGWPANTNPNVDSGADNQSEVECQEVWDAVLQSSPSSTVQRNSRANARYFISVISGAGGDDIGNTGDVCRYELIINTDAAATATHYFDYDLVDGQVTPVTP